MLIALGGSSGKCKMATSFGFGSTPTFGAATTTSAPAFGGFGSTTTNPNPGGTGFGFGSNIAKTTVPTLTFGGGGLTTTTAGSTFGTALGTTSTTTGGSLFGGFGTNPTTTTTGFSFPSFGSTAATTGTAPFGGFGTGTSTLGLGATGTGIGTGFGTGLGAFGTNTLGSTSFGQGAFGTNTLGSTGFGSSGLGTTTSGFGAGPFNLGSLGQGGLGTNLGAGLPGGAFGQGPTNALTNLATALSCPLVFGDERDVILVKWNKLQGYWGTGKGIFTNTGQAVDFTPDNPFCRFKAVGYSCLPTAKNEDGLIALAINKKHSEVLAQQTQLVDCLHRILGSKPTLSVCVEGVKPVPETRTEVIIYILERAPNGASRRIPTSETFMFFNQQNIRNQLGSIGIDAVIPKSAPTKEQLQQYLDNPPAGVDPLLWQQAKLDNPDPQNLIPVPMIGFSELQRRLKLQEQETKQHQGRLDLIAEDIVELQRRNANTVAKIAEHKRKHLELGHRVLKLLVKQETMRKLGYAIQADEEQLKVQLEALQAELSAPTQFKGRLNELMSQIRMQSQQTAMRSEERYSIDNNVQVEIKQVLKQQQEGIAHLINIIRNDTEELKLIEQDLKETVQQR